MPNQITTRSIVLSRTNFAEADRIISVITPDLGKVRLMARGVRKVKSKLAGGIELFSVSQISFIIGKGEIRTLTSSRLEKHFESIVKDVNRTMFGYEILKLIDRNTEDEAGEEYFELLKTSLAALNDEAIEMGIIKLWLYLRLLNLGGQSPNLKTNSEGKPLEESEKYNFDLENMVFIQADRGRYNSKHIKLLRLSMGASPKQISQIKEAEKSLTDNLQLVTTMLKQFVRI